MMDEVSSEAEDDAPTDRVSAPPDATKPAHVGMLDPEIAAAIRGEFAPTMQEEDRITCMATVNADGSVTIPQHMLESRAIRPGDEVMIQLSKLVPSE